MKLITNAVAALGLVLGLAGQTVAQDYPNRPITLIVPYSPGGSTDLTARLVAKHVEPVLGQSIIVENKPGAGAMLGLNQLVMAKPDGYTLGMTNSGMVVQPLYGVAQFNYATEIAGIAQVGEIPFVLAVNAESSYETLDDLISYAEEHPGEIKYGITGVGNTAHIGPEYLSLLADVEMEPVSFDGGAPLITALLGGHIDAAGNNPVDLKEHVKAGTIRVLAVFGEERLEDAVYSDVPTAKELGYDVQVTLWQGVGAPTGLPDDVKATLDAAFGEVLSKPEVKDEIRELGLQPAVLGADAFSEKYVTNQELMRKMVTDTGILEIIESQTQ